MCKLNIIYIYLSHINYIVQPNITYTMYLLGSTAGRLQDPLSTSAGRPQGRPWPGPSGAHRHLPPWYRRPGGFCETAKTLAETPQP